MNRGGDGTLIHLVSTQAEINNLPTMPSAADFYGEGIFLACKNKVFIYIGNKARFLMSFQTCGKILDLKYLPSLQCIVTLEEYQNKVHLILYFNWHCVSETQFMPIPTSIQLISSNLKTGSDAFKSSSYITIVTSLYPFYIDIRLDAQQGAPKNTLGKSLLSIDRMENVIGVICYASETSPNLIKFSVSNDKHRLKIDGVVQLPTFDGWTRISTSPNKNIQTNPSSNIYATQISNNSLTDTNDDIDLLYNITNLSVCGKYVAISYQRGDVVCFKIGRKTKKTKMEENICPHSLMEKIVGLEYVEGKYRRIAQRRPVTHLPCYNDNDSDGNIPSLTLISCYKGDGKEHVYLSLVPKYKIVRFKKEKKQSRKKGKSNKNLNDDDNSGKEKKELVIDVDNKGKYDKNNYYYNQLNKQKSQSSGDLSSYLFSNEANFGLRRKMYIELLEVKNFSICFSQPSTGMIISSCSTNGVYQAVADQRILYTRTLKGITVYSLPDLEYENSETEDDDTFSNSKKRHFEHFIGDPGFKLSLLNNDTRRTSYASPSLYKSLNDNTEQEMLHLVPLLTFKLQGAVGTLVSGERLIMIQFADHNFLTECLTRSAALEAGGRMGKGDGKVDKEKEVFEFPYSLVQHGIKGEPKTRDFQLFLFEMPPMSSVYYTILKNIEMMNSDREKVDPSIYALIASASRDSRNRQYVSNVENISLWEIERFALYMFGKLASLSSSKVQKAGAQALAYSSYPSSTCIPSISEGYVHVYAKNVFKDLSIALQSLNNETAQLCVKICSNEKPMIIGTLMDMPGAKLVRNFKELLPEHFAISSLDFIIHFPSEDIDSFIRKHGFSDVVESLAKYPRILLDRNAPFVIKLVEINPVLISAVLLQIMLKGKKICDACLDCFNPEGSDEKLVLVWEATLCTALMILCSSEGPIDVTPRLLFSKIIEIMTFLIMNGDPNPLKEFPEEFTLPKEIFDGTLHEKDDKNGRREAMLAIIYKAMEKYLLSPRELIDDSELFQGKFSIALKCIETLMDRNLDNIHIFINDNINSAIYIVKHLIKGKSYEETTEEIREFLSIVLEFDKKQGNMETIPLLKASCEAFAKIEINGKYLTPREFISLIPKNAPLIPLSDVIRNVYLLTVSKTIDNYLLEGKMSSNDNIRITKYLDDIDK